MGLLARSGHRETMQLSQDREKDPEVYDDLPVKFLSMRSFAMGVLVSMGGFIFGYDTGKSLWTSQFSKFKHPA